MSRAGPGSFPFAGCRRCAHADAGRLPKGGDHEQCLAVSSASILTCCIFLFAVLGRLRSPLEANVKRHRPYIALALLITGCGKINSPNVGPDGSQDNKALAQIEFSSPISTDEVRSFAGRHGLRIGQVQHSYTMGGQPCRGFLPVTSTMDANQIRSGLQAAYAGFVADLISSDQYAPETAANSDLWRASDVFRSKLPSVGAPIPLSIGLVSGIIAEGDQSSLTALRVGVENVGNVFLATPEMVTPRTPTESYSSGNATLADWTTYTPRGGTIEAKPSSAGGRYLLLGMAWNNVSAFTWISTFEADFFLNNDPNSSLGRGTYLDRTEYTEWNYRRIPRLIYASSTLPRPYLDTRLGDPANEIAYTIGSADADAIVTGTMYYNYIRTWSGDASQDNAKFSSQLGYRSPPNDFSTWGSYGSDRHPIFSAWTIGIPAAFSWSK